MRKLMLVFFVLFFTVAASHAATDLGKRSKKDTVNAFKIQQHVLVKMKDGTTTECVISGRHSKNKYWVRQFKGNRRGLVHKKYIRPITKIDAMEKRKTKNQ